MKLRRGRAWRSMTAALALALLGSSCTGTSHDPRDLEGLQSPAGSEDHPHDPGTDPDHAHDDSGTGGHIAGDGHDHSLVTSSDDLPAWKPVDGLAVPRDDFGTAVVDGEIWALGGMTGERGTRLTSIEVFDTVTETWRTSDITMPAGLASFESVAIGPRIYVFGGFDAESKPSDYAAVLDTRTGTWRDLPSLPHARYAHTVTLHDGLVHVLGGRGPAGPVDEVDVFDPVRRTWSTAEVSMPSARDSHDTVSLPDGLLVVGGWLGDGPTDRVDLYDPRTERWTAEEPLPTPMSRAGVVVADGRVWVSLHRMSYVLDVADREGWEPANAISLSRHGLGYVLVDDELYAIGGCAESPLRDVRTVDKLTLT